MASIFDYTDDPPRKARPVRETRILPPTNLAEIRRIAAGRMAGAEYEKLSRGMPADAVRVDPNYLPTLYERKTREAIKQAEKEARAARTIGDIEIDGPWYMQGQERVAKAAAYWASASAGASGFDPETFDKAMLLMDYMFAPLDTEEKWKAYEEWATSGASYEDMPPGAMSPELMLGVTPGFNDWQAMRDIWKDVKNGETNMFTAMDALSLLPAAGVIFGVIKKSGGGEDIAKLANRLYKQANNVDKVGLVRMVPNPYGMGHTFVFATESGNVIADIERKTKMVDGQEVPVAYVHIIHKEGERISSDQAQTIGKRAMMEIGAQLGEVFPDHMIGGFRVSGSRTHAGTGTGSADTYRQMDFFPPPATEDILAANKEALEIVNGRRIQEGLEPLSIEQVQQIKDERTRTILFSDKPDSRPFPQDTRLERQYLDNRANKVKEQVDKAIGGGLPTSTEVDYQSGRFTVKIGDEGPDQMSITFKDDPLGGNPRIFSVDEMSENFDPGVWDQMRHAASQHAGDNFSFTNTFSFPQSFNSPQGLAPQITADIHNMFDSGYTPQEIFNSLEMDYPYWTPNQLATARNEIDFIRQERASNQGLHYGAGAADPVDPAELGPLGADFDPGELTEAGPRRRRPRPQASEQVNPLADANRAAEGQTSIRIGERDFDADDALNAIDVLEDHYHSKGIDSEDIPLTESGNDARRQAERYLVDQGFDPYLAGAITRQTLQQRNDLFERAMQRSAFNASMRERVGGQTVIGGQASEFMEAGTSVPRLSNTDEAHGFFGRNSFPDTPSGRRDLAEMLMHRMDNDHHAVSRALVAEHGIQPEQSILATREAAIRMGLENPMFTTPAHSDSWVESLRRLWGDESGEVTKQVPSGDPGQPDRRAVPRGEIDEATMERAAQMLEDWNVPVEREGAEPAHWEMVRRAARGEGGDIDLDQMAEVQAGFQRRQSGQSYEDVALAPQYRVRRFAPTDAETFHRALEKAAEQNPRVKDFHTERTLDEWKELGEQGATFLVNETGDIGGAVLPDGDMVNFFNFAPRDVGRGVASEVLIPELIRHGGTKADWFDSRLNELYAPYMEHVDRYAYDPQYGSRVTRDDYSVYEGGAHPETGEQMADVVQGRVTPEMREKYGNPMSERELSEYNRDIILHNPEAKAAFEEEFLRGLDPDTREWYENSNRGVKRNALDSALMQMTPEEMSHLVALGAPNRAWYNTVDASQSAAALRATFGEDAYQYAALLAATSPNVPVPANQRFASDMWTEWVLAGRPDNSEGAIDAIFDMVRRNEGPNTRRESFLGAKADGGDKTHQVETSARNNMLFVLEHPDPKGHFGNPEVWASESRLGLSGPKVNPFFANLAGEMRRFTNDTHMTRGSAQKYNNLSNRAAQTSTYTRAGEHLEEVLGLNPGAIQAANSQAMGWIVFQQLGEMSGKGRRSVEELFFPEGGDINMDAVADLQARIARESERGRFDSLILDDPETMAALQRAGYTPEQISRNFPQGLGSPEADARAAEYALNPEGIEALRRGTRRMDMHYSGDYLRQMAPWLIGGYGARLGLDAYQGNQSLNRMRQGIFGGQEQDQQTPALLQGASLLPLGETLDDRRRRANGGRVAGVGPRPVIQ